MKWALLFLSACGTACPESPPTYTDVQPLVARSCVPCHGAAVRGPNRNEASRDVNYDTYDDVVAHGQTMLDRLQGLGARMPPATASQAKFSSDEVGVFEKWQKCGQKP